MLFYISKGTLVPVIRSVERRVYREATAKRSLAQRDKCASTARDEQACSQGHDERTTLSPTSSASSVSMRSKLQDDASCSITSSAFQGDACCSTKRMRSSQQSAHGQRAEEGSLRSSLMRAVVRTNDLITTIQTLLEPPRGNHRRRCSSRSTDQQGCTAAHCEPPYGR